ncbi:MAG: poly-gamma-glutamate biosynthesis protein [Actinoallomurus sp.]|nr:poly-gamma-glutamate biosynthesis protein [Actinoallomurus sp.]
MAITIALGGDTMLGRGVGDQINATGPYGLLSAEVREIFTDADLSLLNLECCVSNRGRPWQAPGKPFHFRAPPEAIGVLTELGIDCVTLANNHALDFGLDALRDTLRHLARAGIKTVGAGRNRKEARAPAVLETNGTTVAVIGVTDHPEDFAATEDTPGVAYADLSRGVPSWLTTMIEELAEKYDVVLVTPHWGPNMTTEPPQYIRRAAKTLLTAGATLIAGHSAHVFHGVEGPIVYDLGDLIDDYARDERLRNDLGLAALAKIDTSGTTKVSALPLHLQYCHTTAAGAENRAWIKTRLKTACREFATDVEDENRVLTLRTQHRYPQRQTTKP